MSTLAALGSAGPAEIQLACADLAPALDFFVGTLGFRVETIFPADAPKTASLSGYGLRLRLAPGDGDPGVIRLACDNPGPASERRLVAPNGTRIELVEADPAIELPPLREEFIVARAAQGPPPGAGRAGMVYRDLIPGRLGGRFIGSHIVIAEGGPVSDWVHFHKIRFQMIFVRRGWVRVVYEDQGPAFVMAAGDGVLQPPRIRHRVLEASPGLEVVEISCPALHETLSDHDLVLPTGRVLPERDFGGQLFLRHMAAGAPWTAQGDAGFLRQDTGILGATRGLADVCVLRASGADRLAPPAHHGELLFGFLLEGAAQLECRGDHPLGPADAFVIPSGEEWALRHCTSDLALLQVRVSAAN